MWAERGALEVGDGARVGRLRTDGSERIGMIRGAAVTGTVDAMVVGANGWFMKLPDPFHAYRTIAVVGPIQSTSSWLRVFVAKVQQSPRMLVLAAIMLRSGLLTFVSSMISRAASARSTRG